MSHNMLYIYVVIYYIYIYKFKETTRKIKAKISPKANTFRSLEVTF